MTFEPVSGDLFASVSDIGSYDCGEPCAVLPNGARARYCESCLVEYMGEK